jgi:hypothetical protein
LGTRLLDRTGIGGDMKSEKSETVQLCMVGVLLEWNMGIGVLDFETAFLGWVIYP